MSPKDVVQQLVGSFDGWDQDGPVSITVYNVTHEGKAYGAATVDFEKGVVTFFGNNDSGDVEKAIKANLVSIE